MTVFSNSSHISLLQTYPYAILWSVLLSVVSIIAWWVSQRSSIPTINAYRWDFSQRKAWQAYNTNARALIADGFARFSGPFRIITTQGSRIVLPSSFTDWAKSCKELDHQALVHDDFFADYPGFEGQAFVTNPDRILIDVIKTKLSQNAQSISVMNQQLTEVLESTWTDNQDWHSLSWAEDTMSIISRMSASVFVGPELATDPEWQSLVITYTVNLFKAVGALRQWPGFLRPLVHRLLPQTRICREQVQLTRKKIWIVLEKRNQERNTAQAEGTVAVRHEDMITWFEDTAAGRPFDPASGQLALAISALHTTSEAFRQVLLDLCLHPDLLSPMREEIEIAISENGWTMAGLAKMLLVDSVMKESQRFKSAIVGIERKVIRSTTLPGGIKLPRGSIICVDSSDMWSTNVHSHPQIFDGYRFLRMRQQGGKGLSTAPFVSSTKEHNTFGAGRFICPGRFFVANEMKLALAQVLLKYDIRLKDNLKPRDLQTGFYPFSDLEVNVEVRRRERDPNTRL